MAASSACWAAIPIKFLKSTCSFHRSGIHVHPGCPPTFLAQGEDDLITPAAASRVMADRLAEAGVPVVSLVFPHTDHGFDLALPTFNPAARVMLYELDRFLALIGY